MTLSNDNTAPSGVKPAPDQRGFDIETVSSNNETETDAGTIDRMRLQFLASQHASLVSQTQFADAKAAALMTVMGLVALNGPVKIYTVATATIDAIAVFILIMATIGVAAWAVIPRYPDKGLNKLIHRRDRFSWPALVAAGYEPLDHAEFARQASGDQLIMSLAQTNGAMAKVLRRKFVVLRIAFGMAALDLALIVAYVLGARL
ncbi:MAG: Pycsar system effector family protein [Pseudomonadota bacterium]